LPARTFRLPIFDPANMRTAKQIVEAKALGPELKIFAMIYRDGGRDAAHAALIVQK